MTCGKNHALIEWYNPQMPCPVCDALEDLARVVAELEDLKAQHAAQMDGNKYDRES